MNNLYFACTDCCKYIDAGYRWAYWTLQDPGIVQQKEIVSKEQVLAAEKYWNVGDSVEAEWLREKVLPMVRTYIHEHNQHVILFVDEMWIYEREDVGEDWSETATWCSEIS